MPVLLLFRRVKPWLQSLLVVLFFFLLLPGGRARLHHLFTDEGQQQAKEEIRLITQTAERAVRTVHEDIIKGQARKHEWHVSANWMRFITPGAHYGIVEPAQVLRVIDGDTIDVLWRGKRVRVRLIGVDAFEIHDSPKARQDAADLGMDEATMIRIGLMARDYLARLLPPDSSIGLSFPHDSPRTDAYGRVLAYVHLPNGYVVNEILLKEGVARARFLPHNINAVVYRRLEAEARHSKKGIWAAMR